jgi:hypothetical protein
MDSLSIILKAIDEGKVELLKYELSRVRLSSHPRELAEDLLAACVEHSMSLTKSQEILKCLFEIFDSARAKKDPLPIRTGIFINPHFNDRHIRYLLTHLPRRNPIDYFLDLINLGDDQMALEVAQRLVIFFPHLSHEQWNQLVHLTDNFEEEEYENQQLRAFFISQKKKIDK